MQKFSSVTEALDFAIKEEEKAFEFYTRLAAQSDQPWMQEAFKDFAREEAGHKQKLLAIKSGRVFASAEAKVVDLKIADYLVDVEPRPDMDYRDALVVAMKKEKAAYKLYLDLAAATEDLGLRQTFRGLAAEEANHKLRFETEYDEHVLREA